METLSFILAVVALVSAIYVYHRAGGIADLRKQINNIASSEELRRSVESLKGAVEKLELCVTIVR